MSWRVPDKAQSSVRGIEAPGRAKILRQHYRSASARSRRMLAQAFDDADVTTRRFLRACRAVGGACVASPETVYRRRRLER